MAYSASLYWAVDAYKAVQRAEKALEKRKHDLEIVLQGLPKEELSEYVRRTTDR